MSLDSDPFSTMKIGRKKIEIRLFDEKRRLIAIGDKIHFFLRNRPEEAFDAKVIKIRRFINSQDLVEREDFSLTGGLYISPDAWKLAIDRYYSADDQTSYGLVSLHIELLGP